jgi:FAD binding domain
MTRQAASYRKGRVLLAGDAAHVHHEDSQGSDDGFGSRSAALALAAQCRVLSDSCRELRVWAGSCQELLFGEGYLAGTASHSFPDPLRALQSARDSITILRTHGNIPGGQET